MNSLQASCIPEIRDKINVLNEICKYLIYCKNIKKLAPLTLKAYKQDLSLLFSIPIENFTYVTNFDKIKSSDKSHPSYKINIQTDISARSWNRKLSCLRGFIDWYQKHNQNSFFKTPLRLESKKTERTLPKILSIDETLSVFSYLKKNPERTQTLLWVFLYGSGIRISECLLLKWSNLNNKNYSIKIIGKGDKERIVPLPQVFFEKALSLKKPGQDQIFENLTYQSALKLIKRSALNSGVHKPITPHMIRHSYSTHLLRSGVSIRKIQTLLGHASLATTQVYTHLEVEDIRENLSDFHPLKF